jgi:hypothetical protein
MDDPRTDRVSVSATHRDFITAGGESTPRLRLCLVCHRYQLTREYSAMFDALRRRFDVTMVLVDDGWPRAMTAIRDYEQFDACLWFVRFRELVDQPAFSWGDFDGVRVMYDWDAYQNANRLGGDRFLGRWPEVFRRNEFHWLACTGRDVRDDLLAAGVEAYWIPKAADTGQFHPLGRERSGFCYFGERYLSRAAMLDDLRRHGVPVSIFRCSYFDLNEHLNRYAACLVCNMDGRVAPGVGGLLNRIFPSRFITHHTAPETMAKNFEAAAAACVPFADYHPEFDELGFRDGTTTVTYRTFDELREKIHYYAARPEALAAIGARAAAMVAQRHTWDHRARQFETLILETGGRARATPAAARHGGAR